MIDFKLDPTTHDLVVDNFTLGITQTKEEEITQRLKIRLLWFKGDWKYDENYGIDYFNEVFVKGFDLSEIDDMYRLAISSEEGVQDLLSYSSSFNSSTRELQVKAKIVTDSGQILNIIFTV